MDPDAAMGHLLNKVPGFTDIQIGIGGFYDWPGVDVTMFVTQNCFCGVMLIDPSTSKWVSSKVSSFMTENPSKTGS